ncbi:MAG: Eco57I restriction-modification methylase domain-containing protein [Pseudonocardiaceae bacterium]
MSAYRSACPTMGGRADIYVGFYEVGLRSLRPGGRLGFICADRWMRNQYGHRLRELGGRVTRVPGAAASSILVSTASWSPTACTEECPEVGPIGHCRMPHRTS